MPTEYTWTNIIYNYGEPPNRVTFRGRDDPSRPGGIIAFVMHARCRFGDGDLSCGIREFPDGFRWWRGDGDRDAYGDVIDDDRRLWEEGVAPTWEAAWEEMPAPVSEPGDVEVGPVRVVEI